MQDHGDSGSAARLLTHAETARYLRMSESQLYVLNARGCGPRSFKLGKLRRYDVADLKTWLEEHASDRDGGTAA